MKQLLHDDSGVIFSAELVLVGTILVIGMVVGLVELQCSVVDELNDLGEAIGAANQSFATSTIISFKKKGQIKAATAGFAFRDHQDDCDCNECSIVCVLRPVREAPKRGGRGI